MYKYISISIQDNLIKNVNKDVIMTIVHKVIKVIM